MSQLIEDNFYRFIDCKYLYLYNIIMRFIAQSVINQWHLDLY